MNRFLKYDRCFTLKSLGYDEECFAYYENNGITVTFPTTSANGWKWVGNEIIPTNNIKAPQFSEVFRWFREKHNIFHTIQVDQTMEPKFCFSISIYKESELSAGWENPIHSSDLFYTYEEAEEECVDFLISYLSMEVEKTIN